ncbi:MAG TPA: amidase family protein [Steroidobacteraceae bacterium]|nr:amidase family protein [Steroidobacteraceae bacterium]
MRSAKMVHGLKTCLVSFAVSVALLTAHAHADTLDLSTSTIADLQAAMNKGSLTSEKLVSLYLARIQAYDQQGPKLNTVITLSKTALAEARALDAERKAKGPRSPLHGIPVLAKDVFDTRDMPTSGGFKPMATSQPSHDAFVIDKLRKSGAIILGKLNQSDWYGVASQGASTLQGQVISPYNPKKSPGGSSSGTGSAIAAWFAAVGLGSDTTGSIVIPSTLANLVGISATHGLVSRTGMMWSSPSQESGGPMTRSVYDAAAVLDAIAGYDAADLATQASIGKLPSQPYTSFVDKQGLKGARIGILSEMIRKGPQHTEGTALFEKAVADFKKAGATVIEPVLTGLDLPESQTLAGAPTYERAVAIDAYLARLPATAPIRTVAEMIDKGGKLVKPAIVEASQLSALERDTQLIAATKHQQVMRDAILAVMDKYQLDAVILPYRTIVDVEVGLPPNSGGGGGNSDGRNAIASYTGLPTIVVPGGFFASDGMPFAVQFIGRPFAEPSLIKFASGFEATTKHRKAPPTTPALKGELLTF